MSADPEPDPDLIHTAVHAPESGIDREIEFDYALDRLGASGLDGSSLGVRFGLLLELALALFDEPLVVLGPSRLHVFEPEPVRRIAGRRYFGARGLEIVSTGPTEPSRFVRTHLLATLGQGTRPAFAAEGLDLGQLQHLDASRLEQEGAPQLRWIRDVRGDAAERVLVIDLHPIAADGYRLHPEIAALLLSAARAACRLPPNAVPVAFECLSVADVRSAGAALEIRARCTDVPRAVADVVLLAGGHPVVTLRGLTLAGASENAASGVELVAERIRRVADDTLAGGCGSVHEDLLARGASSLDLVRLTAALHGEFGERPLPLELARLRTPRAIADWLLTPQARTSEPMLPVPISRTSGARVPAPGPQRQIWALAQLEPESPRCHIHVRLRVRGALEIGRFEAAVRALEARHAALTTALVHDADGLWQLPGRAARAELGFSDVSALPEGERDRAIAQLARRQAAAPFTLERGPLYRVDVLRLGAMEHVVSFTFHHAAVDGWSLERYFTELAARYERAAGGAPRDGARARGLERPGAPRIDYPDAAAWLHELRASDAWAAQRRYWTAALAGLARLDLPTQNRERHRACAQSVPLQLEASLGPELRAVAAELGTTSLVLFASLYAFTLSRFTGQTEVAIALVTSGRFHPGLEDLVGPLINPVVLRVRVDEENSLAALIGQVGGTLAAALSNAAVPFDEVLAALGCTNAGDCARAGLVWQDWRLPERMAGMELTWDADAPDGSVDASTRFDLELVVAQLGPALRGELRSGAGQVASGTLAAMAEVLRAALLAASTDRNVALRHIALPQAVEQPRVAGDPPARTAAAPESVHAAIAEQCARTPDRIALVYGDRRLTYRELDRASNSLAARLADSGIGPGAHVAVALPRTAPMVEAVLAIWKLGAAYVPIDPSWPNERAREVIESSGAAVVATTAADRAVFESFATPFVVDLGESAARPDGPAAPIVRQAGTAYVMHTSGSTGKPKGVVVSHANVLAFFAGMDRVVDAEEAVWLATTTLAFDISVLELFWTLSRGATVVVGDVLHAAGTGEAGLFGLSDLARRFNVTHLQCTPTLARLLAEDPLGRALLRPLRQLLVGGEALPRWLAGKLAGLVGGRVTNVYGPTETTVWVTAWDVAPDAPRILIGQPLAGSWLEVWDREGRRVPRGAAGELVVGGPYVTQGYLHRPEETAARFVTSRAGERVYRTGDLVRYHDDGGFEWLGRIDRQLKVRGHRVEPEELERALRALPGIAEAAVIADGDADDPALVAFVSATDREDPVGRGLGPGAASRAPVDEARLLDQLALRLPRSLLPRRILALPGLPTTASGKLDVSALRELYAAQHSQPAAPAASETHPGTPAARALEAACRAVLGPSALVWSGDLRSAGASSLAVVRICALLRGYGFRAAPARLMAEVSLAQLARELDACDAPVEADLANEVRAQLSRASTPPARTAPGGDAVLLTGATGFLGAHVLAELRARGERRVVCLVRASDPQHAQDRLRGALVRWGLPVTLIDGVDVLVGSLDAERFGLAEEAWERWAAQLRAIYHCGAEVSFAADYAALRATNVAGTLEAIRLAQHAGAALHHVSTVAIARANGGSVAPGESDPLPAWQALRGGYAQSKWVAEQLVLAARGAGLPASVYRIGLLVGARGSGRMQRSDAFVRALRAVVHTGTCFAAGQRVLPHLTCVDEAARALVRLAELGPEQAVWHVASPERLALSELLRWLRAEGVSVAEVTADEWIRTVGADPRLDGVEDFADVLHEPHTLIAEVDARATHDRLRALGLGFTRFDRPLLSAIVKSALEAEAGPQRAASPCTDESSASARDP